MELQQKINILKKLDVYDKFLCNCLNHHPFYLDFHCLANVYEYMRSNNADIIKNAFMWQYSSEGYDFWKDIDMKYKKAYASKRYYDVTMWADKFIAKNK